MTPSPRSLFVTGTDTGVGKTLTSTVLLHRLRGMGLRAIGMKPVASGCEHTVDGWRNDDALRLQAASDPQPAYADINPYALELATAPQLAARAMGVRVDPVRLCDAYARLVVQADAVVVEGVGGWAAPLDDGLDQVELVRMLDLPVVLVVGLRLGCLNHAILTTEAMARDGVRLAGWIGNVLDPELPALEGNIGTLKTILPMPCLGVLPWQPGATPDALAAHLDLQELLGDAPAA